MGLLGQGRGDAYLELMRLPSPGPVCPYKQYFLTLQKLKGEVETTKLRALNSIWESFFVKAFTVEFWDVF